MFSAKSFTIKVSICESVRTNSINLNIEMFSVFFISEIFHFTGCDFQVDMFTFIIVQRCLTLGRMMTDTIGVRYSTRWTCSPLKVKKIKDKNTLKF